MPRGGIRGGGINLRALAIRQLKSRLQIDVITANGVRVLAPGQTFEGLTSAMAQLAVVKKLGISNVRYLRKKLSVAREFFTKPNQQLHLNEISALIDRAEEACLSRVERRKEKKMLRQIVNSKKPAPAKAASTQTAQVASDERRRYLESLLPAKAVEEKSK